MDINAGSETRTSFERQLLLGGKHGAPRCIAYYDLLRATVRFYRDGAFDGHADWRVMPRDGLTRAKHNLPEKCYGNYCS